MKYAYFNDVEIELPDDCVEECHHQGSCDADVAHWQPKLNLKLDRQFMIDGLAEYGIDRDELNQKDNEELEQYVIWICAGNVQEEEQLND